MNKTNDHTENRYRKMPSRREYLRRLISITMIIMIVAVSAVPALASDNAEPEGETQNTTDVTQEDTDEPADMITDADVGSSSEAIVDEDDTDGIDFDLIMPDVQLPDSDELLEMFVENRAGLETASGSSEAVSSPELSVQQPKLAARRSVLNTYEKTLYDGVKAGLKRIANGDTASAKITVSMSYDSFKNCDTNFVIHTLLADLPYELYWYDKTNGTLSGYSTSNNYAVLYFSVIKEYRSSASPTEVTYSGGSFKLYNTDTSKTKAASSAAATAKRIVSACSDLSVLDKLNEYREIICELTDYNESVSLASDYGDPWQLIYVFDGDESTKVVCEGYAKAFQLLCDLTGFDNIESHIVTGTLYSNSHPSGEGHMWNVLRMDDGRNYLADVTNCDYNHVGYPDYLFLRGYDSGSLTAGYSFGSLTYAYDTETTGMYYSAELKLCGADYDVNGTKTVHHKAVSPTCTKAGNYEYWTLTSNGTTKYYLDCNCTEQTTKSGTVRKALGHSWKTTSTILDYKYQKCSRCGITRKVSTVIVDRPVVKIKKPASAKRAITVRWKKLSASKRKKVKGIEIQYSRSKSFKTYELIKVKRTAKQEKIFGLKKNKTYYVRVRTYKVINGKKHVSKWSKIRKVKTK